MSSLNDQLYTFKSTDSSQLNQAAANILATATMTLLHEQRFLGEVYLQLERHVDVQLTTPLAIDYHEQRLILVYHPQLMQTRIRSSNQLLSLMEHQALHLVFNHPLRYPHHDQWIDLATDLTVNQYQQHPNHDLQLAVFNHQFHMQLPAHLGSNQYLKLLKRSFPNKVLHLAAFDQDNHQQWASFQSEHELLVRGQIKTLVQRAWQNTDNQSRGTMSAALVQHINSRLPSKQIQWRHYLKSGMGTVLFANQETLNRFDRRQPYRMDLHGTVPNWLQDVNVFVDNSGSMGDASVGLILAQITGLLKQLHPQITLLSFDSQVHRQSRRRIHSVHQVQFQRYGGGGTSFQAIFDWLVNHHRRRGLNIILTDGYGEQRLNYRGVKNVLWILTQPVSQFSVQNVHGTVIVLKEEG